MSLKPQKKIQIPCDPFCLVQEGRQEQDWPLFLAAECGYHKGLCGRAQSAHTDLGMIGVKLIQNRFEGFFHIA